VRSGVADRAELAIGGGTDLVPELEELVTEHPLRERLLAALTLALEVFQTARQRLLDELGLEPGPEQHDLQRRILQHDPGLAARHRIAAVGRGGRRAVAVTELLGLAALIAVVLVLSAGAASHRPDLRAGASGIVAIDATSGNVLTATPLPGAPGAATGGDGSV
jgi:hypothetical protein